MVTFVTAWYTYKAKFDKITYQQWINNFLSLVSDFNLVIYTDTESKNMLECGMGNPRVSIVTLPETDFYNYRYSDKWVTNHEKNKLLIDKVSWKVNMLWNEKISFVKRTAENPDIPATEWYVWCDIGYFRNRTNDMPLAILRKMKWPDLNKIGQLNVDKIYYARVADDDTYKRYCDMLLTGQTLPCDQESIAAGFFLIHRAKIPCAHKLHDDMLCSYFEREKLVKDDQIIVLDNIVHHPEHFELIHENSHKYDNWFTFQRYLLY